MGGIAGAVGNVDSASVKRMLDVLRRRGPDGVGYYSNGNIQLGVCRLGVNDASGGGQPIPNGAGDKRVICDGEISNHRELGRQLINKGYEFRTASDTETIIHLYEEYGSACVERLHGMFALAVADDRTLLLARDHLGIKPLYYAFLKEKNLFLFASEIKALLQCEHLGAELDVERLGDLIVPRYPVGNGTFLKGVRCVRPGHVLAVTVRDGQVDLEETPYYGLSLAPDDRMPFEHAKARTSELLIKSVETQLDAEADVGLALSGGLDSTLIALIAHKHCAKKLTTFVVSESHDRQDVKMARRVAEQIKSDHHEILIGFDDYLRAIPNYMQAMEMPVLGLGVPFYLMCREAAKRVRVCLIGEGADMLFGGGGDYLDGSIKIQFLERGLAKAHAQGLVIRDEVAAIVDAICGARDFDQYVHNLFAVNFGDSLVSALRYYDACSMSWGLELRDPFYERDLLDFVNTVPTHFKANHHLLVNKYLLRYIAVEMFGTSVVDAVLRRKVGLGLSCHEHKRRFTQLCESELPDQYLMQHPYGAYFSKKQDVLLFDLFYLIFIRNRGEVPAGLDIMEFIKDRRGGARPPAQTPREQPLRRTRQRPHTLTD